MTEQFNPSPRTELHPGQFSFFGWEGKLQPVKFVKIEQVARGVECDVYSFLDDDTKDLGIIRIQPGCKTPLQKVLLGEKTIEGYISGKGKLSITRAGGRKEVYEVNSEMKDGFKIIVNVDDMMQWEATTDSPLTAYEICFPPKRVDMKKSNS